MEACIQSYLWRKFRLCNAWLRCIMVTSCPHVGAFRLSDLAQTQRCPFLDCIPLPYQLFGGLYTTVIGGLLLMQYHGSAFHVIVWGAGKPACRVGCLELVYEKLSLEKSCLCNTWLRCVMVTSCAHIGAFRLCNLAQTQRCPFLGCWISACGRTDAPQKRPCCPP